ncbi:MAG TPA: chemotaxis protein CheW [Acidisoma sp.]|uniref:chemotaxis protein CheW n=1 Tax=Acidisoma sp. TaxID=1872115 RepID=UPI002CA58D5D|nr:chemotaxis protein CheW [Acidisoma sp.]HTI02469.1 chemotaxis protein CheW [Acidisoma sp.]
MSPAPLPDNPSDAPLPILLCGTAGRQLAIRQSEIAEILPLPRLKVVPEAPPILSGAFHLGGETVFVLPLAELLGLSGPSEGSALYHHLLLLPPRAGEVRLAFLVERVMESVLAEPHLLAPGASFNDCVEGDLRFQGELVPLLNAGRLLAAEERARLAAFADRSLARGAGFEPRGRT